MIAEIFKPEFSKEKGREREKEKVKDKSLGGVYNVKEANQKENKQT